MKIQIGSSLVNSHATIMSVEEVRPDVDAERVLILVRKKIRDCYCGGTGRRAAGNECHFCRPLRQVLKDAAR